MSIFPGVAPELLFAILMESLDGPALVGQAELLGERAVVQAPGEVPLRLGPRPAGDARR